MTPSTDAQQRASTDELLGFYRDMLLIRRFEEKAGQLYGMGLIGGYCHLCIGQEAVAVGLAAAAEPGDRRVCSHRSHGHMLAAGMEPDAIMAELTGRIGGQSRGKGGSMHMFAPELGFFGGHGIVGAPGPIGAGLAFAGWYRGDRSVAFACFGDGAARQGQIWEAMDLAQSWSLPCVFVIENNNVATPLRRGAKIPPPLHARAAALGMPAEPVDGMDVLAVRDAARRAAEHARIGRGPFCLEVTTYRYRGHSMADPAKYRTREEQRRVRESRDPIETLRLRLLDDDAASEKKLREIDAETRERISAAARFAQESPEPAATELDVGVWA